MNRKTASIIALLCMLIITACAPQVAPQPVLSGTPNASSGPAGTVTVMAAASLTAAFQEIGSQFESQHAGVRVEFNFAGSQQLAQQIAQGAPADVFASANQLQMDTAVKAGKIDPTAPQAFAHNRLVVIYPKSNPAGILRLQDLANPGIKIVLAAKEVPAGQYALDFFDKASQDVAFGTSFKANVLNNVVSYEDNVKAVLTKVSLNEADAGIVYTTDAAAAQADTIGQLEIPDAYNVIASYPIAIIQGSQNQVLAKAFIDEVLSPDGQAVLSKYGFIPVTK